MKKVLRATVLTIATFIIVSFVSYAGEDIGEVLELYVGEIEIIPVSNPRRVVIGNPNVADVTNVTKSEITIAPKAVGVTTLVFWDNFGEQPYQIKVFSEDMNEIKRRVDNLLKALNLSGIYTKAVDEEGKVLLLGSIKSAQEKERIMFALGPLRDKVVDLIELKEEDAIVEIDVQVLELNKDATNTLGLTWPGALNIAEASSLGTTTGGATSIGTLFKILSWERGTTSASSGTATITPDPFSFKVDFLVQEGKARILSRPRLACQSGKEAELLVGGEKPIMTTQAVYGGGTGTEVEYKEFGIKLKIKPTVREEERINLVLNVEVSDVGTAETLGTFNSAGAATETTAKAYPLSKRSTSTELIMDNGQTLAIGGLIKQKTEEDLRKMPWLGDVPILGVFFRKRTTRAGGGTGERGDTELFITITPKIISKREVAVKEAIKGKIVLPPTIEEGSVDPLLGYARIVQKRILEKLTYPSLAKEAGFQGEVRLKLRLSSSGQLLEAVVKKSSGYRVLDDRALSVAKETSAYPPFPPSIDLNEIWIEVPVVYRLD